MKAESGVEFDYVASHGRRYASELALLDLATQRCWTWQELDESINRTAHWLIDKLGARSGARVATLARNSAEQIILQFGCVRAGAIFVPLNWRLAAAEINVLAADCTPALLLHDAEWSLVMPHPTGICLGELLSLGRVHPSSPPPPEARQPWEAPSTLIYTSGTTGAAKGVTISEANAFWGATNFMLGNGVSQESVFLCDMPLFHTAGLFANARTPLLAGGRLLISRGFDARLTASRLADHALGVTHYFCVPQMAQMLWNDPGFDASLLAHLRVLATGGAPNSSAQVARFVEAGVPMSDGFGMSETGSNFGMPVSDARRLLDKAGSIGLPYVGIQARIVDDFGTDVSEGEVGELWLRGPSITQGYWNQPVKTAEAFSDGWFRTGDTARRDADGFYFLVGRKKDMFISGGENVYPAEVEAAIAGLATVAEVAVIGVPDPRWGEVGRAYVVPVAGRKVSAEAIHEHCAIRLAGYKVPKTIVFTESIPHTASGKVQKHLLRERARAELA